LIQLRLTFRDATLQTLTLGRDARQFRFHLRDLAVAVLENEQFLDNIKH
jgi:hypothetical protein